MPEIREILIVVNTAEVREGAQAINQLADASGQAGRQVRETSVAIRISEQATRAQEEATRAAADAARVLGEQSSDASDAVLKAAEAVDGFARASLKIGEGSMNADVGKIKEGLGELADVSGLTELAISRLGTGPVAALKMLGDVAAFTATAYVKGQQQSDSFAKAMQLTGNSAGITEGQFNAMVKSVANLDSAGMGDARAALQTLLDTGDFAGDALLSVGAAAVKTAQITGQPVETVAADFAKMADGVVNWVDTHSEMYRTLGASQYKHIKALEDEGRMQEAMTATAKNYNEVLQKRGENLGFVGTAMRALKTLWSNGEDSVNGIGRRTTTEEKIVQVKLEMESAKVTGYATLGMNEGLGMTGKELQRFLEQKAKELLRLDNELIEERKVSGNQAAVQTKDHAQKQAQKGIDALKEIYGQKISQERAALEKYNSYVATLNETALAIPVVEQERMRADIRAAHKVASPLPAFGSDPSEAKRTGQLQAIQDELRLKTEGYEQLAKLDELRRKGNDLSDEQYFERRRSTVQGRGAAEAEAYQKQIDVLTAYQAKTPQAVQENKNKIAEAGAAKSRVAPRVQAEVQQVDEIARQQAAETLKKQQEEAKVKKAKGRADTKDADDQQWKDAADGAKALGDALEKVFGKVGGTIGKMTSALVDYKKAQQDIQRTLKNSKEDAGEDEPKKIAATAKAQYDSTQAQMKGYGDMAGAAAGFFDKQSTGYKVLTTVSQVFHAAETAMTLAEIVPKAISAVLNQGSGDPYTAFGRMAAMAAIVAGLGVAIGGGGGGGSVDVSKERQKANGTGTVLGDSSAKSESIANSLTIMEKNSGLGLVYSSSMVVSLKQIVSGIGGLGSLLVRSDTLTATLATKGSASGGMLGNIGNSIFGGKTSVIDTGIVTSQTALGDLDKSGIKVNAYVDSKKSGGWFSSDKYRTALSGLGSETGDQFTKIILGLRTTIVAASDTLGLGGDAFAARLNTFVVNLGKISLKDLKGEELQKALEAAFSKLGDDMAKFGVGGLEKYQQVGEGYLETLARVANNYMQVSDVLAVLGKSFQVTGLGAVVLSENLIDAAGDLDALTSGTSFFVDNFLTEAERMAPITKSVNDAMGKLGLAGVTTMDGFKAAVLNAADGVALGKDGAAQLYAGLLALAEPFKTAADYAADLAAATGDYAAVTKTAAEIASERKDLQSQLEQLTLSAMQLRAKEREALDAGNRALFDQVAARQDLASAYETESTAISGAIDKLKTFGGELITFRNGLALGSLSPLSPTAKEAEAQRQYGEMLGKASAGDVAAQSGLTGAASAYLTASQAASGTAGQYARDYARVQADMAIMAASVGSQVTAAEAQQLALDKQVAGLVKLNDSVNAGAATVAQAIATLGMLGVKQIAGVAAGGLVSASQAGVGTVINAGEGAPTVLEPRNFAAQASLGNEALVNEIKGLREDNRALKEELTSFKVQSQTENVAIVQSVGKLSRLADRWDADGMPTRELA